MIKIYVDSMPEKAEDCPLYGISNKKCRITDDKCCLAKKHPSCEHLATLSFDFSEVDDGLTDTQSES